MYLRNVMRLTTPYTRRETVTQAGGEKPYDLTFNEAVAGDAEAAWDGDVGDGSAFADSIVLYNNGPDNLEVRFRPGGTKWFLIPKGAALSIDGAKIVSMRARCPDLAGSADWSAVLTANR